jgi:hypothetical protein
MFFDIGGWWLSCDHMFRRFGTPFAVDWLAKNVNGYVYTPAIPADPAMRIAPRIGRLQQDRRQCQNDKRHGFPFLLIVPFARRVRGLF